VAWTSSDIGDLSGKTAVVTGANSGLGLQTALALASHGAHVVMACRDQARGASALDQVRAAAPSGSAELATLDLADLRSVRAFGAAFADSHDALDILVNNAGVMAIPRRLTADGFEMQIGTNHLGHFALTGLLLVPLLARPAARVVTVTSNAAALGRIHFDDLHGSRRYSAWLAYGQSKLANQIFSLELDRRVKAAGLGLVSVAAHPGYAATHITSGASAGSSLMQLLTQIGNVILAQSDADGALPSLYGATAPGVRGGEYFGPDQIFGMRGGPTAVVPVREATKLDIAHRLWTMSVELTGVDFTLLSPVAP
jgi:NAD(P)-dependent dehydrogenase (short-subunit alcohol dehydrogenase family)